MALRLRGLFLFSIIFVGEVGGRVSLAGAAESPAVRQAGAERLDLSLCSDEPTFWRRARFRGHDQYCMSVLRAQANLGTRPRLAEKQARDALKISPRGVVAQLLVGESLLFQNRPSLAHAQLSKWMSVAPKAVLTPRVTVSAARAAMLSAHYGDAAVLYRGAVLRLDAFPSESEQARILIEAATAVAYISPDTGREIRGYLAIARQKSAPLLLETLVGAWVLSLFREGRLEEASNMAKSLGDSWTLAWILERQQPSCGKPWEVMPVLPPGEGTALVAAVTFALDPPEAEPHWQNFREVAAPTWPDHIGKTVPGSEPRAMEE